MPVASLPPARLRRACTHQFEFETTASLPVESTLFGQERGLDALAFGLAMAGPGYNVFVLGEPGTGRATAVREYVEARAKTEPTPADWVYVHNFDDPRHPHLLSLPAGEGRKLQLALATWSEEAEAALRQTQESALAVVETQFAALQNSYATTPEVSRYLTTIYDDMRRLVELSEGGPESSLPTYRYLVSLFVDHASTVGAPVVFEAYPTLANLLGRFGDERGSGGTVADLLAIQAGTLQQANGGYLIVDAGRLRRHLDAWEGLKRALLDGKVALPYRAADGPGAPVAFLQSQSIPLNVKVVLLGDEDLYYEFYERDAGFRELFKVKAEFESYMPRDEAHELHYATFIARHCHETGLRHLARGAVEKIVEFGSRLSEDQNRLSTQFGAVADLLRESDYWAASAGHDVVNAEDVQRALQERVKRASREQERLRELVLRGDVRIATAGGVVGQVNGLSVLDMGDYAFGQPGRITARTYMGEDGVINIEREVDLAGPIHNKGLLTLVGYLGGTYAQHQPLSLSASLTFEQNYMEIDGDSASAAELYALLSSLSGLPVAQGIAVTGSCDQWGEIQPVGGVTEKIEGFFAVCSARGLTGDQGVLIPEANVSNLILNDDVIAAVEKGCFHIWPMRHVDEGMALLLGCPAGTPDDEGHYPEGSVHHAVQEKLRMLALELKSFGDHGDEE